MIKIGITGNIGAGKSVVEKFLKEKGYPVIDTDETVHNLFENSVELREKLMLAYGQYDILSEGVINRQKLAKVVFKDEVLRKKLEEIIHPLVIKELYKFFEIHKNSEFVFVSVPLLFEVNWRSLFDKVIVVVSKDEIRLERLISKRKMTEEDAISRMKAQMPQEEKIKLSDYVIYNDTSFTDLSEQTDNILQIL